MRTSYRDIALLACCQALLLINNSGLIAMNGLVGYALVDNKTFATLGATSFVVGSAFAAMPAALWMAKVGRRRGFMTGSAIAVAGAAMCALALWLGSFALFCFGTAVIGIYTAFGLQYRFAAAEVAAPEFRAKAISLVLAGGIAGGFLALWQACGQWTYCRFASWVRFWSSRPLRSSPSACGRKCAYRRRAWKRPAAADVP